jgi:hypothetical protein
LAGEDVTLAEVDARLAGVDERQVEIDRDRLASGPDAEVLDLPAVHRIEQPGHQRQPGTLARVVVIEDGVGHGHDHMITASGFGQSAAVRFAATSMLRCNVIA